MLKDSVHCTLECQVQYTGGRQEGGGVSQLASLSIQAFGHLGAVYYTWQCTLVNTTCTVLRTMYMCFAFGEFNFRLDE